MRGLPRRRPYPYDTVLSGTGLMLGRPARSAVLVAKKASTMEEVSPTDFAYSAQSPFVEKVHPWEALNRGFGLALQKQFQDQRTHYTLNLDTSWPITVKGPDITDLTPATTDRVSKFFEVGSTLYALAGRYALKRESDASWTVSKDFGLGESATDVVVFADNSTETTYAYVAMGDAAAMYRFDGTTWTQHASLFARAFASVGRDFYRAHDTNHLAKVDEDADPWTAGNWTAGNAFRVGDQTSPITSLAVTLNRALLIFKTDGVYTLQSDGEDTDLFPFLHESPDDDNGKYTFAFENSVHASYREGHFRIGSDFSYETIGVERNGSNDSPIRGRITAGLGHLTFAAYAGIWNPDEDKSYLIKFRAYDENGQALDVWNGSLGPEWDGKHVTAMGQSSIGASTDHQRCYIGFDDGSLAWFTLPCNPNPVNCDEYRFTTDDGKLYVPRWHGLFQADAKTLRSLTVTGPNLDSDNYVQAEYKTTPDAASYTAFGTDFTAGPRQKEDFPNNTSATMADFLFTFVSTANTDTPQVSGIGLHHAVRPALVLEYQYRVLADDGLARRDGALMKIGAPTIRSVVKTAAETAGSVTQMLPDESSQQLSVVDYGEALGWDDRRRAWLAALAVRAVQFTTNTIYGTYERMEAYSYGSMENFSYGGLENL